MAFIIDPFEMLEVEIPAGKGTVTLTFPPLDCFTPEQVEKMNAQLSAVEEGTPDHLDPNKNPIALASVGPLAGCTTAVLASFDYWFA